MRYFTYHSEGTNIILIGTDREQIKKTLTHYGLPIPPDHNMFELPRVMVMCALDPSGTDHFIRANVTDRVIFKVHANAFEHIKKITKDYRSLKRGSLYKFDTGRKDHGVFFLPECIMKALKAYDWERHRGEVKEWLKTEKEANPLSDETGQFFVKPT